MKPAQRIDSLVGATVKIQGNVEFAGGLRIDGCVCGNVAGRVGEPSTLVLSELGCIEGEIQSCVVVVNGAVRGSVRGTEYVELQPKASVTGDVYYKTIEIQLGALVDGRLVHEESDGGGKIVALKHPATSIE